MKILPANNKLVKQHETVINNFQFANKLFFMVSPARQKNKHPEILEKYVEEFTGLITNKYGDLISEINYRVSEKSIMGSLLSLYGNLPTMLDEKDYQYIDEKITADQVASSLKTGYKILLSPAGGYYKKLFVKDPVGLMNLVKMKLGKLWVDENYTVHNGYYYTKDGDNLLMFLTSSSSSSDTYKNKILLESIDNTIEYLKSKYKGKIVTRYYGPMLVAVSNAERIKKDVKLTVTASLIIIVSLVSIYFRKISIIFIIFVPIIFAVSISLAMLHLFIPKISAISIGIGSVLVGITVDYAIHLCNHYKNKLQMDNVLKDLVTPVSTSCMTTAMAFLCLLAVQSEGLRDMSLFVSISIIVSALFTFTIIPHLLKFKSKPVLKSSPRSNVINKIAGYNYEKNKALVIIIVGLVIVSMVGVGKIGYETDLSKMNYLAPRYKPWEEKFNSIFRFDTNNINIVVPGNDVDTAMKKNEHVLAKLDKMSQQGVIEGYVSGTTIVVSQQLQKQRVQLWKKYWTGEKVSKLAEILRKEEKNYGFKPGTFNEFLDFLTADHQPVPFNKVDKGIKEMILDNWMNIKPGKVLIMNLVRSKDDKKTLVNELKTIDEDIIIFDEQEFTAKLLEIIKKDFVLIAKLSVVVIFLILVFAMGDVRVAVVTIVPIGLSWIFTMGVMGMLGINLNIMNIMISTFIFGLGVDYSIMIVNAKLQGYKTGEDNMTSYKESILLSAFTTLAGFGVLAFAKHPALNTIGVSAMIGLVSVMLNSFVLEPVLVEWVLKKKIAVDAVL